jgi:hypothetical protein
MLKQWVGPACPAAGDRLIDLETHRAAFTWVLQCLSTAGLVKGELFIARPVSRRTILRIAAFSPAADRVCLCPSLWRRIVVRSGAARGVAHVIECGRRVRAILDALPTVRGVLFDLPPV